MKVNLLLSKRVDANGHSEVLLLVRRRLKGRVVDIRAKSGVFIDPNMFDSNKKMIRTFSANKMLTENVKYHNEQLKKLNELILRINDAYNNEFDKENVCGDWLERIVNPSNVNDVSIDKNIYNLFERYINSKQRTISTKRCLHSAVCCIERYELYVREVERSRRDYTFNVDSITRKDIEELREYIGKEKTLSEDNPKLFDKIMCNTIVCRNKSRIISKCGNSICKIMLNIKSFFKWLNNEKITDNRPFDGFEFGSENYGTPYYITTKERDIIAEAKMPTSRLETQRDIFILQCFIGCRVSDLKNLSESNITEDVIIYTPRKTKGNGKQALQVRVPIHPNAMKIINKYRGVDKSGRLVPFKSTVIYNQYIKKIFKISGITRMVEVMNPLTGDIENRPINEVASSHLARRTFVGNLYSKVADPNLIGKMSGHVDGSKAFSRYRKIEDDTLREVVKLL